MVNRLTPQVQSRIGDAIAAAEANTSGEIFCVLARRVSSYRDISLGWAAGAAMLLPLGLIPLGPIPLGQLQSGAVPVACPVPGPGPGPQGCGAPATGT
jgi:hypothetical protein